jgi:hypothetical protein
LSVSTFEFIQRSDASSPDPKSFVRGYCQGPHPRHRLRHNNDWVNDHISKEEVIRNHFNSFMENGATRTHDFNWEELQFEMSDFQSLGDTFTEEEVKFAIHQMPSDKASGPNGFTSASSS